jgi:glucan phosphoethanolaminetransferase (alkaline phosphatase superfamily)
MNLQMMIIFGGVMLLFVALIAKILVSRTPFQRVAVGFTILWASFAAFHFWAAAITMMQLVVRTDSEEVRVLGGFWLAFLLACLPGVIMIQSWMRRWSPEVPEWFEKMAGGLSVTLIVFLLLAHALLCCGIALPQARAFMRSGTTPGRILSSCSQLTFRTYLRVGARVCRMGQEDLARERTPYDEIQSIYTRTVAPPPQIPSIDP